MTSSLRGLTHFHSHSSSPSGGPFDTLTDRNAARDEQENIFMSQNIFPRLLWQGKMHWLKTAGV